MEVKVMTILFLLQRVCLYVKKTKTQMAYHVCTLVYVMIDGQMLFEVNYKFLKIRKKRFLRDIEIEYLFTGKRQHIYITNDNKNTSLDDRRHYQHEHTVSKWLWQHSRLRMKI